MIVLKRKPSMVKSIGQEVASEDFDYRDIIVPVPVAVKTLREVDHGVKHYLNGVKHDLSVRHYIVPSVRLHGESPTETEEVHLSPEDEEPRAGRTAADANQEYQQEMNCMFSQINYILI